VDVAFEDRAASHRDDPEPRRVRVVRRRRPGGTDKPGGLLHGRFRTREEHRLEHVPQESLGPIALDGSADLLAGDDRLGVVRSRKQMEDERAGDEFPAFQIDLLEILLPGQRSRIHIRPRGPDIRPIPTSDAHALAALGAAALQDETSALGGHPASGSRGCGRA
jgi:hypothetical protein